MRKIVLSNGFFLEAAEALKKGQTVKLLVGGQSMYPFIRGGRDLIEVIPYPAKGELPGWCCPFYQWEGRYMIHRYIGHEGDECLMMGDGNIVRIERVKREEIIGLLRYIYPPDRARQDCFDKHWLKKAEWWYRLKFLRRWLLLIFKFYEHCS